MPRRPGKGCQGRRAQAGDRDAGLTPAGRFTLQRCDAARGGDHQPVRRARAVLDAAETAILEFGGRSFTLDAVAAHAGTSKGGLVYSFATKDDLVHAALEREMARFRKAA